jgi:hypothetical protein
MCMLSSEVRIGGEVSAGGTSQKDTIPLLEHAAAGRGMNGDVVMACSAELTVGFVLECPV